MSALDSMLAAVREKGGDPKVLIAHPTGIEGLGGEAHVRVWCELNQVKLRVSPSTPPDTVYFVTPPDKSWK